MKRMKRFLFALFKFFYGRSAISKLPVIVLPYVQFCNYLNLKRIVFCCAKGKIFHL